MAIFNSYVKLPEGTHEKMGFVQFAKLTGYPENSPFLGQLLSRAGRLDLAIHLVSKDPRRRSPGGDGIDGTWRFVA